ncbi:MAG: UDP-N-acetylmuramoyl-L-alanyl-D-glutamate--2,6-diaminopimelate ligase [Tissierellaceae bacterium]|nr:UDP-N-acetylmuramoyl-L-alanyl-D-glutamate--2,6-diaminopimelate ligase [Tissierellaceae bacterium]
MKLRDLLGNYEFKLLKGNIDVGISGIENDSRKVQKGDIFVAEKGYTADGHEFINSAIDKGAVAVVLEREMEIAQDIVVVKVEDSIDALAWLSNSFFGNPWDSLDTIGITGTNGKTSTSYFIKKIFEEEGKKTGIIGTMGAIIGDEEISIDNTTPNSLTIQNILKQMVTGKLDTVIMEVSSHALELKRVNYMFFDVGLFTNLTKDHLDYHKTMDSYFQSKVKLFSKTRKYNIINIDDQYGKKLANLIGDEIPLLTYGIKNKSDVYASDIKLTLNKVGFKLYTPKGNIPVTLNIPGEFSVYNALAAATCAIAYDIDLDTIKRGLESIEGIKGRFEVVPTNTDYTVIIDFAHTADGLEKVLTVIDEFAKGRKIVVFGAGGNRDRSKRPEMGETVGNHADISIVTSDNPRFEEPENIINDILIGMMRTKGEYVKIVDRKKAIEYALDIAKPQDIILLAGKGHELYTIVKGETVPFDERQIVLEHLKKKI